MTRQPRSRFVVRLLASLVGLFCAASGLAEPPELSELWPPGGQRGTALKLRIRGTGFGDEAKVRSSVPASFTRLSPDAGGRGKERELLFLVELGAEAEPGLYPLRIETEGGISNILLFSVSPFAETVERETTAGREEAANDHPQQAQWIETPVVVNGTLGGGDRDVYRLRAKAGEKLVFEVEARRAGSAIDPVIRVLDMAGRVLARNNDAPSIGVDSRCEVTFPGDGDYFVEVHDARFSDQEQNFYRLKIGRFAYAETMFPLGWQRGREIKVELGGGNLGGPATVRPEAGPAGERAHTTLLRIPGAPGSLPLPFQLGDGPERIEPRRDSPRDTVAIEPGTVMNGRIAGPGERDRYRLAVEPGEEWFIELRGGELGTSRLYGVLSVHDPGGKLLGVGGYEVGPDDPNRVGSTYRTNTYPSVALKVPEGTGELLIEVADLLERGGPGFGYRLSARRHAPDFLLTIDTPYLNIPLKGSAVVRVTAERRGFWGPIQLSIPNAPDDLIVEGGYILAESDTRRIRRKFQQGILTITPKPGARRRAWNLVVQGEGETEDGGVLRRRARGSGLVTEVAGRNQRPLTAEWLNLELPAVTTPAQPAILEVLTPRYVRMIPGMEHEIRWSVAARQSGAELPKRVRIVGNTGGQVTIKDPKEDRKAGSGKLLVRTTERTTVTTLDFALSAKVTIDGRTETIFSPAVRLDLVRGYSVHPETGVTLLRPGGRAVLAGRLEREPDFLSPIHLSAEGLPAGVECDAAELAAGENHFRLACRAETSAKPGAYEIDLVSRSTLSGPRDTKVPYKIAPVRTRLEISGDAAPDRRAGR